MKGKKGQLTLYIVFMILAIFILLIAAILAPMGVLMNSEFYAIGEGLILDANDTISEISDDEIRTQIQNTLSTALAAEQTNIEVNAAIFQYGWVIMLIVTSLVLFLISRKLVESNVGGFV